MTTDNYNTTIWKLFFSLIFFLWLLIGYNGLFTNQYTPCGDGSRIMPYVEFADNAKRFYPFWNPYKLGGVPVLSTPERYIWVSKLINPNSAYANFQLNMLLLLEVCLLSFVLYLLARELAMSEKGALIVILIVSHCWYIKKFVFSGRVNGLAAFIIINAAFLFYIKYLKHNRKFFLSLTCFFFGYLICAMGHYLIILFYPFIICTGIYYRRSCGLIKAVSVSLVESVLISIIGMATFAVFFLPQVQYLFVKHLQFKSKTTLAHWLPPQASLPNISFPIFLINSKLNDKLYPFISICALPLLTFLFIKRNEAENKTYYIFFAVFLFVFIFFIGNLFPFNLLLDFVAKIPILNHIRENAGIQYTFTITLAFLSGYGFDAIKYGRSKSTLQFFIPLFSLLLLVVFTLILDRLYLLKNPETKFSVQFFIEDFKTNFDSFTKLKFGLLLLLLIVPYTRLGKTTHTYIFVIVLFLMQLFIFNITTDSYCISNKPPYPEITAYLRNDATYYRIWTGTFNYAAPTELGMAGIATLNGDSKYFSKENRMQLACLYKMKIDSLRPGWIRDIPRFCDWNPEILKLLNIKYILTENKHRNDPYLLENWIPVVEEESKIVFLKYRKRFGMINKPVSREKTLKRILWKKKDWVCSLKVVDDWEVIKNTDSVVQKISDKEFMAFNKIYLEEEPEFRKDTYMNVPLKFSVALIRYAEDEIILNLTTNKNGILSLPEYYDNGWKASIDGRDAEIIRAYASYRAVPVTKGTHIVKLHYRPLIVRIGALISMITIVIGIVVSSFDCVSRRRPLSSSVESG